MGYGRFDTRTIRYKDNSVQGQFGIGQFGIRQFGTWIVTLYIYFSIFLKTSIGMESTEHPTVAL